jgi:hypothetical protein
VLGYFLRQEGVVSKFSGAGLISAFSLVLIAISGILISTVLNLLKK